MIDVDPFALFCAYHLGLDVRAPSKARHRNAHEVARMFGIEPDALEVLLRAHGLDAARMLSLDFDLASARLDLEASPPGVDLLSIAQMHWEAFLSAPDKPRDWTRELEDDAAANAETFGRVTTKDRGDA
jgi:hypothetical protein